MLFRLIPNIKENKPFENDNLTSELQVNTGYCTSMGTALQFKKRLSPKTTELERVWQSLNTFCILIWIKANHTRAGSHQ